MVEEPVREQYVDLPYTQFPATEDTHSRMSDVGADTADLVDLFGAYYEARNWEGCTVLLSEHPELENCMFDAEKFNWLRDAVISMQRYFINNIQQYFNDAKVYIAQLEGVEVGLDDTESGESSPFTTYSAHKIDRMYKVDYHVSDSFADKWKSRIDAGVIGGDDDEDSSLVLSVINGALNVTYHDGEE